MTCIQYIVVIISNLFEEQTYVRHMFVIERDSMNYNNAHWTIRFMFKSHIKTHTGRWYSR